MQKKKFKNKKNERCNLVETYLNKKSGITLIALVVTMVVLLILAGIAINLLWGEHGILNTAKNAGVQAKIAEIEDQANVIYKGLETEKLVGTRENITMSEIATKLQANGYTIEKETGAGSVVTGITIDNTKLTLAPNETATITVTPKESTDTNVYYAVIEGKYYKMDFTEGGVVIQRTKTDKEITPSENKIETTSENKEITGEPIVNGMLVNITAQKVGTATITINYGGQTATCEVQVKIKPAQGATADVENVTFSTAYGKIDVIWLQNGTNTVNSIPNAPELYGGENALKPVTWTYDETAKTWSEDTIAKSTWYNYSEGTGTLDNNSSMWANAKNTDGSYFVWIPRYAYRITYYENDPTDEANKNQEPTGYYDGLGMWKAVDRKLKMCLRKWNRNSRI